MDDQRDDHPDPERPTKNLLTHNVPTDAGENTKVTNKGWYLHLIDKS